nr:MAG TPA: hypothetical protein [Caudoviricetes sp.]
MEPDSQQSENLNSKKYRRKHRNLQRNPTT